MEDRRRSWLRHWHSVIDAEVGADPSFDFGAAYDDPYGDFRMHFLTWDLSEDALHRCFDVLPLGRQMADRAIEMRSLYRGNALKLSDDAAVDLFQAGLDAYCQFSDDPELRKPIRVRQVTSDDLNSATANTDRVAVLLEDVDWQIPAENGEAGSFLRETLYRLAHSYDVVDHIEWPLVGDTQSAEPDRPFALLAITGIYFPLLDEDGPVLFVITDNTG
ncbi:hypothetical protein SAMN06265222_102382 [Neorhodopirellula lusitana]|uniref:Uncharacterized protein n=1 Tax=Neorhodopirellula lusitana TaxID=445327 RepID=A0ABY1PVI0_9BACT|nr:hypothetical protein [Neorhodopirellula lusitana]SMP48111.1 hypothetical protein SAMN06265222_102382 [Neorhodopirellula lusitana]